MSYKNHDNSLILVVAGVVAFVLIIAALVFGGPYYSVWQQGLEGKAELMKAEYTRQVAVLEAQAKFESAKQLAQAEIERAKGVSEANRIVADSLKGNTEYLSYLWVTGLQEGAEKGNKTVYMIPSQGSIPAPVFNVDKANNSR
jgi:regulator of protease activity HflC (stomatin/prohibitin superfamily)